MWNTIGLRHHPVNNHASALSIRRTYHDYSVCIHQYLLAVCMALFCIGQQIRLNLFAALKDILPFAFIATAVMAATYYVTIGFANLYLLMASKIIIAGTLYTAILWLSGSVTFKESLHYIIKK